MIVAFAGFSGWADAAFIRTDIDRWLGERELAGRLSGDGIPLTVRVGDEAEGAELIIRSWLYGIDGINLAVYTADVTGLGRTTAKAVANKRMLIGEDTWDTTAGKPADLLIAYPQPDRASPAKRSTTWNAITQAVYRGVDVRIPGYEPSAAFLSAEAGAL